MEIEERVKRHLDSHGYSGLEDYQLNQESQYTLGDIMDEIEIGYICGATEQRAIDIDKAYEWLRARNVLTDASLEGFRKAMEE